MGEVMDVGQNQQMGAQFRNAVFWKNMCIQSCVLFNLCNI